MLELADPELLAAVGSTTAARRSQEAPARTAEGPRIVNLTNGVRTITSRAEFDALAEEWRALEAAAAGAVFFQSYDWCRAVWDHHARSGHAFEPLILTLRERGKLIGVLPLQRVGSGLTRLATGFGEPYQQYSDVVLAPDAPASAVARLFDAACNAKGCQGLTLLKVRDDSPLVPLLAARGARRTNEDAAPFVDLTPFADFKAYLATVNAKTRKNMRNARNRLARGATLDHAVLTEPADVEALAARAHAGRERWLDEQGLTSRAFRDGSFGAFATAAARPGNRLDTLAMCLSLDGRPIADQWGFVFNGRYYAYVATWAPEFEESSPGKLHLEEVIRACHERGIGIADFLMPAARYKFIWTDQATPLADYALPLSVGARLHFRLWSGGLRPILKRFALSLPVGLRSRIARHLLPKS